MNRQTSFLPSILLAGAGLLAAASGVAEAQYTTRPTTNTQVQYIPGLGAVYQNQFVDPNTGVSRTVTHSYLGSSINQNQNSNTSPVIVGYRTVFVTRWVMTPFGPQLVRQPVTVPITR